MTAENSSNVENVALLNGNATNNQPKIQQKPNGDANIFRTIMLTIYDVLIFLAVSVGYISQVSIQFISFVTFKKEVKNHFFFALVFFLTTEYFSYVE